MKKSLKKKWNFYNNLDNKLMKFIFKKNLLADKEFLSTEVVVVEEDVDTSPNTEFMFEEFWVEWFVEDVGAKLLAFKTLEVLVVLATSYVC